MSSIVKVALPILGGIAGSIIPGLGTELGATLGGALGGYVGGRSYGGGNQGGMIGAVLGGAGGYFGADAMSQLGQGALGAAGLGSEAAASASSTAQGITEFDSANSMMGGGTGTTASSSTDMLQRLGQNKGLIRGALTAGSALLPLAGNISKTSDPFGPYRGQYGAELAQLEANPGSITTRPGYAAGLQAIERSLASQGYTGSGNSMFALANYGQNFFNAEANRLATLAGAGAPPGQGGANAYQIEQNAMRGFGAGVGQMMGPGG
jgi:hypothetical protein